MSETTEPTEPAIGIAALRRAVQALQSACPYLGEHAKSEAGHFARRIEDLIPLAEKELRGERYECRCCGEKSFRPFGALDGTLCGPCHNGAHFGHEPTPEVRAKNEKDWGRPPRVM